MFDNYHMSIELKNGNKRIVAKSVMYPDKYYIFHPMGSEEKRYFDVEEFISFVNTSEVVKLYGFFSSLDLLSWIREEDTKPYTIFKDNKS